MTTETALSAQPCQPYVHPYGHEHSLQLDLMQDLSVTLEAIGVHWRRVETAWTYPRHSHAQFELKMVTQGTLGMELAGETFRLQAGDMILVPPYQIHRAWAEGDAPAAFFCVHIGIDEPFMLRTMCRLRRPFFPAASETAQAVRPQMELLERCARAPDNSLALRMRRVSAMFDLLAVLADATATLIDERSEAELKAERFADQLATAMEARVAAGQEIGIGALCQQLGVSTSHGNLLFRTVYGMAPRDYASRVRERRARMLLLDEDLSIERVAQQLGFDEPAHFSRQFKRWSGMSPRDFRTRHVRA